MIREFEFLELLTVSLLTQHRVESPFALHGGSPGTPGHQTLLRHGTATKLEGCTSFPVHPGDRVTLATPGGGGWGA